MSCRVERIDFAAEDQNGRAQQYVTDLAGSSRPRVRSGKRRYTLQPSAAERFRTRTIRGMKISTRAVNSFRNCNVLLKCITLRNQNSRNVAPGLCTSMPDQNTKCVEVGGRDLPLFKPRPTFGCHFPASIRVSFRGQEHECIAGSTRGI